MSESDEKKGKINNLPLKIKLKAIEDLENEVATVSEIAANLKVRPATVRKWEVNKAKMREWSKSSRTQGSEKKQKRISKKTHDMIDKAMYRWYKMATAKGEGVTDAALQEQARRFHTLLGDQEEYFVASVMWLRSWKKRYSIPKSFATLTWIGDLPEKSMIQRMKERRVEEKIAEKIRQELDDNDDENGVD